MLQQFGTSTSEKGYCVAGILVDIVNDDPETNESNNSRETGLLVHLGEGHDMDAAPRVGAAFVLSYPAS